MAWGIGTATRATCQSVVPARGAVFLPVLVPSEDQLDSDANDVTAFRLLLRSATFAYLDLLETMRAQAHGREELYRDNMHFTARGNSVIAERIADALGTELLEDRAGGTARAQRARS